MRQLHIVETRGPSKGVPKQARIMDRLPESKKRKSERGVAAQIRVDAITRRSGAPAGLSTLMPALCPCSHLLRTLFPFPRWRVSTDRLCHVGFGLDSHEADELTPTKRDLGRYCT
jgi:hypothetical protein